MSSIALFFFSLLPYTNGSCGSVVKSPFFLTAYPYSPFFSLQISLVFGFEYSFPSPFYVNSELPRIHPSENYLVFFPCSLWWSFPYFLKSAYMRFFVRGSYEWCSGSMFTQHRKSNGFTFRICRFLSLGCFSQREFSSRRRVVFFFTLPFSRLFLYSEENKSAFFCKYHITPLLTSAITTPLCSS